MWGIGGESEGKRAESLCIEQERRRRAVGQLNLGLGEESAVEQRGEKAFNGST